MAVFFCECLILWKHIIMIFFRLFRVVATSKTANYKFSVFCRCRMATLATTQKNLKKIMDMFFHKLHWLKKDLHRQTQKIYSHFIEISGPWGNFDYLNEGYPLAELIPALTYTWPKFGGTSTTLFGKASRPKFGPSLGQTSTWAKFVPNSTIFLQKFNVLLCNTIKINPTIILVFLNNIAFYLHKDRYIHCLLLIKCCSITQ